MHWKCFFAADCAEGESSLMCVLNEPEPGPSRGLHERIVKTWVSGTALAADTLAAVGWGGFVGG